MLVNRCEQGTGGAETGTGGTKKRKKVQLNLGGLSMHSPNTATQSYSPPDVHDFPMAPTSSSKMKVMVQHEVKGPIPVPRRDRSRSLCVDKLPTFYKQPPSPVFDVKFRHLGTAKANAILGRRGSEYSSATSGSVDRLTVQAVYTCSSATDLAARRGVFSRRHYGSVEMLTSCDGDNENVVRRFRVETGERSDKDELFGSPSTPVLENPEYQTRWYFKYFLGKLHQNYVGADAEKNPFFLSVVLTDANSQGTQQYRAILWRKTGALRICLSHCPNKPLTVKSILSNFETLDRVDKGPKEIFSPDIQKDLLLLEEQEGSVNFKFGVLYALAGQTTDDEMFSNETGNKDFERLVNLLGGKVRLKGWDKYRGGLDVKGDMTGKQSVYTIYEGHEIMFHVSTLLPYSKDNRQQVERKRHIGNDIVNIIYLEGNYEDHINFKPSMIKSQFTHIFAVITYDKSEDAFRLSLFSEESVPLFGPTLPCPPVFHNHQEFREFLLVKLINGEKAAFNTPIFAQKRERTLDMLIKDLYHEHISDRGTMLNRRAFSDVLPETPRGSRRKEEARQVEFVRIGQALKLDTIVKGDAPTSLATTSLFKREPWEPHCFYPDFPHEVICGDSWAEKRLVLATEAGIYIIEEGLQHRQIFDKSVQVKQLSVVEAHGILLLRTDRGRDSRVHVFRLSDFEIDLSFGAVKTRHDLREHRLERTKGCHLYSLSRPGGSHLRMAVCISRKLLLMQWRHSAAWTTWCAASDTDTIDGFQLVRELNVNEAPVICTLVDTPRPGADNQICVGYRHQFDLINEKTGEIVRLHNLDKVERLHLVAALDIYEDDEAELLLCYNHTTHFQKLQEETINTFNFQWNAMPEGVVCVFPYIMGFNYDSIEIRLIINGNLVHNMAMPKLKLIASKSDIFFASTAPEFFQVRKDRVRDDPTAQMGQQGQYFTFNNNLSAINRDPSLSPPSSPHSTGSTGSNGGVDGGAAVGGSGLKPVRIYRISFSCLTGNASPCERRCPTPSLPSPAAFLTAANSAPGATSVTHNNYAQQQYLSPDFQEGCGGRPSRSACASPVPPLRSLSPYGSSKRSVMHITHANNSSNSSDSGLGRSLGASPPASPFPTSAAPATTTAANTTPGASAATNNGK
ncbi:GTPase-activating Rap/Ran-GAP domain-like protein 3 isoform X3 [Varroa destructor]|uniref:GTPase-activating Rap/Ran-GAP domain-like protein 3 n=1 Tax=Varroa destructor TaxID=109461 RepID=A0A7M7IZ20_VARDE|nr:GTPase-activating Rap/Ran-GAP domain-like protein 3 isoform X3 [Varroa destructor]